MHFSILLRLLQGAEPNYCGWGRHTPHPALHLWNLKTELEAVARGPNANSSKLTEWVRNMYYGEGKNPGYGNYFIKCSIEVVILSTIIASPPNQKPIKTEMGGAWKSVRVVLKMNDFSHNLTWVLNLKNKLSGVSATPHLCNHNCHISGEYGVDPPTHLSTPTPFQTPTLVITTVTMLGILGRPSI